MLNIIIVSRFTGGFGKAIIPFVTAMYADFILELSFSVRVISVSISISIISLENGCCLYPVFSVIISRCTVLMLVGD